MHGAMHVLNIAHTENRLAATLVNAQDPFGDAGEQLISIDAVLRCEFVGVGIWTGAKKHDLVALLHARDICHVQHA